VPVLERERELRCSKANDNNDADYEQISFSFHNQFFRSSPERRRLNK
jgi:hypothetical protein